MLLRRTLLLGLAAVPFLPSVGRSQERVLNIYSARHYDTDRTLYDGFTAATGIRIRLIEAPAD
jgi:iron(III) transport system substrate-binding protein